MFKALRWVFKFLSALIALVIILFIFLLVGGAFINSPPDKAPIPEEDAMSFDDSSILHLEVKDGESSDSVGKRLENAGVIRSRYLWFFLSRVNKEYLKTGTYSIELPASQTQIRSILISGEQRLLRVTIPEGATLKKTARILENEGICSAEDFLSAAASREILNTYRVPGTQWKDTCFRIPICFKKTFRLQK
ncbi:MAG: endolytic transglycosylase MltG [Treponema sp.]|nr:endolytic transglycosylase MltG [Treponema sp.]